MVYISVSILFGQEVTQNLCVIDIDFEGIMLLKIDFFLSTCTNYIGTFSESLLLIFLRKLIVYYSATDITDSKFKQ